MGELVVGGDPLRVASAGVDEPFALVWDHAGQPRVRLRNGCGAISAFAFSPDGKSIVTGGKDAVIR